MAEVRKNRIGKRKITTLVITKDKKAKTVTEAAFLLEINRVTLQDWFKKYRDGGLEELLRQKVGTGRPKEIPIWAEKALEKKLKSSEVFDNYEKN